MSALQGTAIVVGVASEQGLGAALSRRFVREGYNVIVSGRTESKLARVVRTIIDEGGKAEAAVVDATVEADVVALFNRVETDGTGGLDLVVFNAGNNAPHDFRTMPAEFFEQTWRIATFGGFLVGREAALRMAPRDRGTIIFTGASASLRVRRLRHSNTAAAQFKIERGTDGLLNIDAIADAYWHLHRQHPSAWTHELDLRPFKEPF
jgi:NAD(P)-dependent dehydrogenase (short-subunit alcohol dehydrogenase family)